MRIAVIMQLSSGLTRHQISDREPDATYHAAKGYMANTLKVEHSAALKKIEALSAG
jgi:hypothetical protein